MSRWKAVEAGVDRGTFDIGKICDSAACAAHVKDG